MSIETSEKPQKNCEDLLGLYFTSPDEARDRYVHAFSFSRYVLESMIANNIQDEEKEYYSVEPIKLYRLIEWDTDNPSFPESMKNKRHSLACLDKMAYSDIGYPIYGYNNMYMSKGCISCEQVLLSTNKIIEQIENNGVSSNPIEIDTFYEEGILNA